MTEFNFPMPPGQYAPDVDLEQDAKKTKGFWRFMKKIIWYHYNRYSSPLTKILWTLNALVLGAVGIVTGTISAIILSVGCYICILCDRGFGEPDCPY